MVYFHPWEIAERLVWRREAGWRANLTRHAFRRRMCNRVARTLALIQGAAGPMADVLDAFGDAIDFWSPAECEELSRSRIRPAAVLDPPD